MFYWSGFLFLLVLPKTLQYPEYVATPVPSSTTTPTLSRRSTTTSCPASRRRRPATRNPPSPPPSPPPFPPTTEPCPTRTRCWSPNINFILVTVTLCLKSGTPSRTRLGQLVLIWVQICVVTMKWELPKCIKAEKIMIGFFLLLGRRQEKCDVITYTSPPQPGVDSELAEGVNSSQCILTII